MIDNRGRVIPVAIEDEVKESYLNYAMSVIVSRALPDVRDGLKPVHRRILYAMSEMGLRHEKSYKKCGRIVGDVLGKYHPHGDQSIYDALVRLAQDFSLRYTVVDGQGNFGSVDGDPPAAMRYTEARMQKITEEILRDIKKRTIDWGPNYDDSIEEPLFLPTAIPFLLLNGASGIAVGMATNMAPHNLTEVSNAIVATIKNPEIELEELLTFVKGPDFPTAGIIHGKKGIRKAYETGRGKIVIRSRTSLEELKNGKEAIIVTELPYQVNKAQLIIKMADLVKEKKIEGIADLRDESDRNGMRIVIELKKGTTPKIILNQLFSHTNLQMNFNVNNLALVNGRPRLCNLKDLIQYFIDHRKDVIIRRTKYDLEKAEQRAHILRGLKIALENIDEVVEIIKTSQNVNEARDRLMARFHLDEVQSQAILDMRLQKLTSLETKKIVDELNEILALIEYLKDLLAHEEKILQVIIDETNEIKEKYGDERRTEIVPYELNDIDVEDLIEKEDVAVLVSNKGYVKRIPVSAYRIQGRGGKGSYSAKLRDEDFIENIFIASTHDYIMIFSNKGTAYWLKVHEIPEGSKTSRGSHIKNLLEFKENEEVASILSLKEFSENTFVVMASKNGLVFKFSTFQFRNARAKGIIGVNLKEEDQIVSTKMTDGKGHIVLVSANGYALKFSEESLRATGRGTSGVRGIKLREGDELVGFVKETEEERILVLTHYGSGKRMEYLDLHPHGRGTQGQICYKINEKTGKVVGVLSVSSEHEIVCITAQGKTIKIDPSQISTMGRNAMGVKCVSIEDPDFLVGIAKAGNEEEEKTDEETKE